MLLSIDINWTALTVCFTGAGFFILVIGKIFSREKDAIINGERIKNLEKDMEEVRSDIKELKKRK